MSHRARYAMVVILAAATACASGDGAGQLGDAGDVVDAGAPDAARSGDSLPLGAISFFNKTSCPTGWMQYAAGVGRFVVPSAAAADVGAMHGTALASGEDRLHGHGLSASIDLGDTSFAGVAGGGNGGVANAGTAAFTTTTDAASSGLPYVQLLMCKKITQPATAAVPLPRGTLLFFGSACPDGWSQSALTQGRWLVGVPEGAMAGLTFGGPGMPTAEDRVHAHTASGAVTTASHGIALASGCCAGGYAANGTYPYTVTTADGTVDLPYLQLLQCRKE